MTAAQCPVINGQKVQVRFLKHEDLAELEAGFACLSKKTLLHRFLGSIRRLSPSQLEYLANTDNKSHVAICGYVLEGGMERGLGIARYVKEPNDESAAEFSLLVIDPYQNRGLGQYLLLHLISHAQSNGVQLLRGHVRDDNEPMLRIIRKNGGAVERRIGNVYVLGMRFGNAPPNQAL